MSKWALIAGLTGLVLAVAPAAAQDLVVAPGAGLLSLAEALRQAPPHARIVVKPGLYQPGALVVERPVEIVGEGYPVLDGEGVHPILTIRADSVTVRGLHFRNVATSFVDDRAAVTVDEARDCRIENNRFEDTFFGIYLARTASCRITGNDLQGSQASQTRSGNGIHLWYSKDITVEGNQVRGHRDGIYFEFVEDSHIRDNVSEGNLRYGLHFMFSDRCTYEDNVFRGNAAGVAVMYTRHVAMRRNRFEHNWGPASYGLLLKDITDSQVEDNAFEDNTVGIYAEGLNRVEVARNTFVRNGWALKLLANSFGSTFTDNVFVANTFDVATNSRQSYSTFRANYWDAYRGYDLDRDGYGDVPFRPVRLFSLLVERNEPSLALLRSFFIDLLDAAERVLPVLTPETLIDAQPRMRNPL